jgi:hypothetical protein
MANISVPVDGRAQFDPATVMMANYSPWAVAFDRGRGEGHAWRKLYLKEFVASCAEG